jgi:hypothetical protein
MNTPNAETNCDEIARFGGMIVQICRKQSQDCPYLRVVSDGCEYRLRLPDLRAMPASDAPPVGIKHLLVNWFEMELQLSDGSIGTIWELVHQQWCRAQDDEAVECVPSPDDIKDQGRKRVLDGIADFGRMNIYFVRSEKLQRACFYAKYSGNEYRFDLWTRQSTASSKNPPAAIQQSLKRWLDTPVSLPDGSMGTVWDLIMIQWTHSRSRDPVTRVPNPEELKNPLYKKPNQTPDYIQWNQYPLLSVRPLSGYRLRVQFTNRMVKIVDIFRLVGRWPVFLPIFAVFDRAEYNKFDAYWPVADNVIEIEARDLWMHGVLEKQSIANAAKN